MRWHKARCWSSFAHKIYQSPHNHQHFLIVTKKHWPLCPEERNHYIFIVAYNRHSCLKVCVCMTIVTSLVSQRNHLSFIWLTFWFSHQRKTKPFQALDVSTSTSAWCKSGGYLLYLKTWMYLEILNDLTMALIDFLEFLSLLFCTIRSDLGVLIVFGHFRRFTLGYCCRIPVSNFQLFVTFDNKRESNFQEATNL